MTWLDLAALVLVAAAAFDGARGGLVWAALETFGIVLAAIASKSFAPHLEPYVAKVADLAPDHVAGAAYLVVFAATSAVVAGAVFLLKPATRRRRFRRDGWFGAALGVVNGVAVSLLFFAVAAGSARRASIEDALSTSRLAPTLAAVHDGGFAWLFPEHLPRRLDELRRP